MTDQEAQEKRALVQQIELGMDVEHALGRPAARYLMQRAEEHRQSNLEALAGLNPDDPVERVAMRRAQVEVAAVDRWQSWLAEAIQEGRQAQMILIEREQG